MSQPPKPRGLGRGLSALLGDDDVAATVTPAPPPAAAPAAAPPPPAAPSRTPFTLPIAHLRAGPYQPRTTFDDMESLVDSIRRFGLLQPILVRPVFGDPNAYEIIAGERRWRAAQQAQLHDVPVVVRPFDNLEALQIALIENLQRTDLSAIDEARGYERLHAEFNQTQEDIAEKVGKSRPHVANTMRLLDLPPEVQEMVQQGKLSAGQGRTLLGGPDPLAMAERAVKEKLTVRELERLVAAAKSPKPRSASKKSATAGEKTADTRVLEKRIEEALGLKASLSLTGRGEHTLLTLEIANFDQLDDVVERLTRR
jgi:ParB family transcriptional regulator, chromosome partitioning protein